MIENEISILEIDKKQIVALLEKLGAVKTQQVLLKVWWYCTKGDDPEHLPWYLRVRSYNDKNFEVCWKALSKTKSHSRYHTEINFHVDDLAALKHFFENIGMEFYAYQEKERISYTLKTWRFDIDTYPGIPTYLEIEGKTNKSLIQAIKLLNLTTNPTWNQGERILIDKHYQKNWYEMRFK
ncbi:MAG: hypothetical protein WCJ58_05510 [bacterium]